LLLAGCGGGHPLEERHRGGPVPPGQRAKGLVEIGVPAGRQRGRARVAERGLERGQTGRRRVGERGRAHSASRARKSGSAGHAAETASARKETLRAVVRAAAYISSLSARRR